MSNITRLVTESFVEAEALRKRWKFESSSIFYTNPWTSLVPGTTYLVGTNPGGSDDIPSQTEAGIAVLGTAKPWSLYLDEDNWQADNLQRNLARLADAAFPGGRDSLRGIFATNAMFLRDDDGRLKTMAQHVFEDCWKRHALYLEEVKPSHIVAFGNGAGSAYALFKGKLRNARSLGSDLNVYNNFSIRACVGELPLASGGWPVTLTGLPHLSRCNVAKNQETLTHPRMRGWLPE